MSRVENEPTGDAGAARMVAVIVATVIGRRPGVVLSHPIGPLQSRQDDARGAGEASAELTADVDWYTPFILERRLWRANARRAA